VRGEGLCAACWAKLSPIAPPYCERLGIPFAYDPGPGILSMEAVADPPAYRRARAAVRYDEVARSLVHALKYGDRLDLAPIMGRWMATAGAGLIAEADALVPVPLHWRRLWARRFNQRPPSPRSGTRDCDQTPTQTWPPPTGRLSSERASNARRLGVCRRRPSCLPPRVLWMMS
jgi:hypothetical protein